MALLYRPNPAKVELRIPENFTQINKDKFFFVQDETVQDENGTFRNIIFASKVQLKMKSGRNESILIDLELFIGYFEQSFIGRLRQNQRRWLA